MEKTKAVVSVEVWCDCPHCDYFVGLREQFVSSGILKAARKREIHEVVCPECHEPFEVELTR